MKSIIYTESIQSENTRHTHPVLMYTHTHTSSTNVHNVKRTHCWIYAEADKQQNVNKPAEPL